MHQDMRGYLRIRNVLSAEEVAELNAAFDLMEDMDQVCDSDTVNPPGGVGCWCRARPPPAARR